MNLLKSKKIAKIILLFILPAILFIMIYYPTFADMKLKPDIENKEWKVITPYEKPGPLYVMQHILDVPFELTWYTFCFENGNTAVIYSNGSTSDIKVYVEYEIENETYRREIPKQTSFCLPVNLKTKFMYRWEFETLFIFDTQKSFNLTYIEHPDVKTGFMPEPWSLVTKIFLFWIVYLGVVLIINNTIRFLRE